MRSRPLGRQLGLVRGVRGMRLLALATLGSGLGTWLAYVALAIDVYDRTGSGAWVSALLIADFLPIVLVGIVAGPLLDRFRRRRLLIGADVARLVIFCLLPFAGSATVIVALAALAGIATSFFRPVVYAGLPNLVDDAELPAANSLIQAVENVSWMVGPLIGGALVAGFGPDLAYWCNAATFALSAVLILGIPAARLQAGTAATRGHWRDVGEGLAAVRRSGPLLTVLAVWTIVMIGNAGINVAEVVLAKVSLDGGDFGFGLLVGATGLGLAIGSLAAAESVDRRGAREVYAGSIALMALGFGLAAISQNVWVAAACVALAAIGNGSALVCNVLIVQRATSDRVRGRVVTLLMSSTYAVLGLGMAAAGPITDAAGPRWVWAGSAALYAIAAALALTLAARSEAAEPRSVAATAE